MADVGIPDDILHNILARLPTKSLVRFRFVSKHWMRLITDPYFMKSRSRRMILLSTASLLHLVDDNLPIGDPDHSVVNLCPPFEPKKGTKITIVGTFNGIVLLVLSYWTTKYFCGLPYHEFITTSRMILYNPLTRVSKEFPNPPDNDATTRAIGFGYGATQDDLKIVTIDVHKTCHGEWNNFNVLDVKTNSWSVPLSLVVPAYSFRDQMEGTFVNGFLHWLAYINGIEKVILALNVKEMVYSEIDLPQCNDKVQYSLGSVNGCLCLIKAKTSYTKFDVWMLKEEGVSMKSWSKMFSFDFGLEGKMFFYPLCILDHGRILMGEINLDHGRVLMGMGDVSVRLSIYNSSTHSSKSLISAKFEKFGFVRGIEFVESFVSPLDMC